MANFCLMPAAVQKFKQGFADGSIDPYKLNQMTSAERREVFKNIVGDDDAAKEVNSLFESKMLLKNQKLAYTAWAKKVAGLTPDVRRDLITRISKMDKVLNPEDEKSFLHDLASTRLGVDVTADEAKTITDMSKQTEEAKAKANDDGTFNSEDDRLDYGRKQVALSNYVNDLKVNAQKIKLGNLLKNPLSTSDKLLARLPGEAKAINASMDDSAIFRQGWKTLWTNPIIWQRNARKSFVNLVKQFGGKNVMDELNADIHSRPNFVNGNYDKAKLAVGNLEEAFPTTAPEKIPLFGRFYKASEAAYTAFVQKTRADVFDKYMEIAEKSGVNTTDKTELQSIGHLVNSLTGRGDLGSFERVGNKVNNVFFSPRFLKSNIDLITQPFGRGGAETTFARKRAAINLLKVISGTAAVITTANAILPGSVELDPRSSDFGKIKIGDTRFDVTGGVGSIITLASRLAPILAGKPPESKSTTTKQITKLNSGKFGSETGLDVVNDFIDNKLSPAAGIIRDLAQGKDTSGNKATPLNEIGNAFQPMGLQNIEQMNADPNHANELVTAIIDGLGISSNTYGASQNGGKSPWLTSTSKEISQFKSKVGNPKFNQAADEYNKQLNFDIDAITSEPTYKNLSTADQKQVITNEKANLQAEIFKKYGFTYKEAKPNTTKNSFLESLTKAKKTASSGINYQ